ncbi:MAG: DUF1553 domain-containing protein [Planctomycetaceae bacterium]|nr:DUF1553 domain-containing protein [Planctomycetaceae bacterium]
MRWIPAIFLLTVVTGFANGGHAVFGADETATNQAQTAVKQSPQETARLIDAYFEHVWAENHIVAALPADDAEFLRRIYLDLAGRIPSIAEARSFLSDERPDKRELLVEELLDGPAYVRHLTTVLRNSLIPQANSQAQFRSLIPGFEAWLWERISKGTPYDQMAREIITTPVGNGQAGFGVLETASSPEAFFLVRELRPENLATGTSRAFLGVRLDCAQCHDHPFDQWKQRQFWSLAAFYSGFSRPDADDGDGSPAVVAERPGVREITLPGSDEVVPASFLTSTSPNWDDVDSSAASVRRVLAEWVTARENPWFAKMAVNRIWAQYFGRGIVHPIDDFSDANPPSHPAVLDLLATQFILHDYDMRFLARTLTATRVYQLSSAQSHVGQQDEEMFARAALRGLTPEQFFDSLAEAVGYYQPFQSDNPFVLNTESPRSRFLELFRSESESPLHQETTILQALAMINGEFVATATSLEDSLTLRAVADFPLMDDSERLEALFLATFSRPPSEDERTMFVEWVEGAESAEARRQRLGDVLWVLLNSSEFLLNH